MYVCTDTKGWLKLHRGIADSALMSEPDLFTVWVRLLLWAHWQDGADAKFHGKQVKLKRGQLIITQREIAEALGLSPAKVQRTIQRLKIDERIDARSDKQGTLITILNYEKYQDASCNGDERFDERFDKRPMNDPPSTRAYSNIEEGKKVKKENIPTPVDAGARGEGAVLTETLPKEQAQSCAKTGHPPERTELALLWLKHYRGLFDWLPPYTATEAQFANDIRAIEQALGVSTARVAEVFRFMVKDPFWKTKPIQPGALLEFSPGAKQRKIDTILAKLKAQPFNPLEHEITNTTISKEAPF